MRKFRTLFAVSALAAVALLVPSTAQAATPGQTSTNTISTHVYRWDG